MTNKITGNLKEYKNSVRERQNKTKIKRANALSCISGHPGRERKFWADGQPDITTSAH
ncbi:MAG: hypothetical protein ABW185_16200 [Sedimenticola sp.]